MSVRFFEPKRQRNGRRDFLQLIDFFFIIQIVRNDQIRLVGQQLLRIDRPIANIPDAGKFIRIRAQIVGGCRRRLDTERQQVAHVLDRRNRFRLRRDGDFVTCRIRIRARCRRLLLLRAGVGRAFVRIGCRCRLRFVCAACRQHYCQYQKIKSR